MGKKQKSAKEIINQFGAQDIKGYCLVNNYGYVFEKDGRRYDARFWANCYGASPMAWRVMTLRGDNEALPPKPSWVTELEDKLNSDECSERS